MWPEVLLDALNLSGEQHAALAEYNHNQQVIESLGSDFVPLYCMAAIFIRFLSKRHLVWTGFQRVTKENRMQMGIPTTGVIRGKRDRHWFSKAIKQS